MTIELKLGYNVYKLPVYLSDRYILVKKGTFTAVLLSLIVHSLILFVMFVTQPGQQKIVKSPSKHAPIKSFIYYAPKLDKTELKAIKTKPLAKEIPIEDLPTVKKNHENAKMKQASKPKNTEKLIDKALDKTLNKALKKPFNDTISQVSELPKARPKTSQPKPLPEPTRSKLDSFMQLQRLRSKLNQNSVSNTDNPYQSEQPPSIFNNDVKTVPHSVPLKDEAQTREKNTKNMGAGIAITKGDDGRCSITQDLSAYGLSEGSSTQFFSCGESKFDTSFREHMKKVKAKLGKK
ncbi:hypothetical protein [Colwellia sp. MB3u-4]|uniref:hypothetical protein n=1 Tax=Colwellia sp. MB3u-4 TaxID=2759822 RepID=UPI0015F70510|nr:hypothetical protein [Colwellia sp. MB3u-4]MBA6288153.1 hypothetical protein [Colwellia sp. MB3u-4]